MSVPSVPSSTLKSRSDGDPPAWHALGIDVALDELGADPPRGLGAAEVRARRTHFGDNALKEPPRPTWVRQLLGQFMDPLVGALLLAALVAFAVALDENASAGPWWMRLSDPLAILLIVTVNAALGFVQERRAEAALSALSAMAAPTAKVRRDGRVQVVPARELLPGDLVELNAGDAVPADLRLIETHELATEESALTGESVPVEKNAQASVTMDASVAERATMAYLGTDAVRGHAVAVVAATGPRTELGRIGGLIRAADLRESPLEKHLGRLGRAILLICIALSGLLFAIGVLKGGRPIPELLLVAVSLAVAAIPEGLPAITTITLALGMQRMARRGAIIRRLPAVETLGSATVICSDKTGTLTMNRMVAKVVVTEAGEFPLGEMRAPGALVAPSLAMALRVGVICNHSCKESAPAGGSGPAQAAVGDPTEIALLRAAGDLGIERPELMRELRVERELPFDSERKRMTLIVSDGSGQSVAYVKGSLDILLPRCDRVWTEAGPVALTDAIRQRFTEAHDVYAGRALRLLGLAVRDAPDEADPERGLVLVGVIGLWDPPRDEAKRAIAECKKAGVRVVMITGDHRSTAVAIARELGLWEAGALSLDGRALGKLDDEKLAALVERTAVFARVTAEQKLRLVRALQARGHVVAMTGDGVNDAPALKEADIGVAMGKSGTDVAREAADMVLADDNFATIVSAVRQGRAIFSNVQKFIFFLNSSNAGLVVAVIVASFFGGLPQLVPLQLLWINLVTNGLPALALGVDPPDPGQMQDAPRDPQRGVMGLWDLMGVLAMGALMGASALAMYGMVDVLPGWIGGHSRAEALERARTMAFTLLAVAPLLHAFNCRSGRQSLLARGTTRNPMLYGAVALSLALQLFTIWTPPLHPMFRTHWLVASEWALVLAFAALPIPAAELFKLGARRWARRARGVRATTR